MTPPRRSQRFPTVHCGQRGPPAAKKIRHVAQLFPNDVYKIRGKLLDRFRRFRIAEKVRPADVLR
jgi:hypothetical protein